MYVEILHLVLEYKNLIKDKNIKKIITDYLK